jgi:hypothetical protein
MAEDHMVMREDFENRIAEALLKGWERTGHYRLADSKIEYWIRARRQAKQIAEMLPGLFRTDIIEVG